MPARPTGGGKSLTYLLPGVCPGPEVTVVLSPLIALMREQTEFLRDRGVVASALWSGASEGIKAAIYSGLEVESPLIRVLFCTPEGAVVGRTAAAIESLARRRLLRLVAVDEAHCISRCGHTESCAVSSPERPPKTSAPPSCSKAGATSFVPPIVPLEGCARACPVFHFSPLRLPRPRRCLQTSWRSSECEARAYSGAALTAPILHFMSSSRSSCEIPLRISATNFARCHPAALSSTVRGKCREGSEFAPLLEPASRAAHKREEADRLAEEISRQGMTASSYHAGLSHTERGATQDAWMNGSIRFVVATGGRA